MKIFVIAFILFLFSPQFVMGQDTDGDGILNSIDLDDDNDGILDSEECGFGLRVRAWNNLADLNEIVTPPFSLPINPIFPENRAEVTQVIYGDGLLKIIPSAPDTDAYMNRVGSLGGGNEIISGPGLRNLEGGVSLSGNYFLAEGFLKLPDTYTTVALRVTGADAYADRQALFVSHNGSGTPTFSHDDLRYVGESKDGNATAIITLNNTGTNYVRFAFSLNDGFANSSVKIEWNVDGAGFSDIPFSSILKVDQDDLTDDIPGTCIADTDTDGDGTPNRLDLDSDNDGCNDVVESGGTDANNDGILDGTGFDADGLVTGGTGGYDGATGNELVATQVVVDATALEDQNVAPGSSTSFTITSASATSTTTYTLPGTPDYNLGTDVSSTLVYQWQEDGVNLTNTGVYSGTNTITLSISDVTGLFGKVYNLVITHPDNVCIDVQNSATLLADPCDPIASGNTDTDGDGVSDICDLDDDNDGILDVNDEMTSLDVFSALPQSITTTTTTPQTLTGSGGVAVDVTLSSPSNAYETRQTIFITGYRIGNENIDEEITFSFSQPVTEIRISSIGLDNTVDNKEVMRLEVNGVAHTFDPANFVITTGDPYISADGLSIAGPPSGGSGIFDYTVVMPEGIISMKLINDLITGIPNGAIYDVRLSGGVLGPADTDGDGIPDYLDLDSDNDGISDIVESGFANSPYDLNNDGTITIAEAEAVLGAGNADADGDGLMDIFDADITDASTTASIGTIPTESTDDTDTLANYLDLDSDGDGIPDTVEARLTAGYTTNDGDVTDNDLDGDGIIDLFDSNDGTTSLFGGSFLTPEDTDSDTTFDYLDTDSDDDTLLDSAESGLTLSGTDANNDGIDDDATIAASYTDPDGTINDPQINLANETGDTTEVGYREVPDPCDPIASGNTDTDGDGIADLCDLDDDNDGILDIEEGCYQCDSTIESVTTDFQITNNGGGDPSYLINASFGNPGGEDFYETYFALASQTVPSANGNNGIFYINFNKPIAVKNFRIVLDREDSFIENGTEYLVEGFNGTTYDNLTGTLTSNGTAENFEEYIDMSSNTTLYSSYRIRLISGVISWDAYILEILFSTDSCPAGLPIVKGTNPITAITTELAAGGGTINEAYDTYYNRSFYLANQAFTAEDVIFDITLAQASVLDNITVWCDGGDGGTFSSFLPNGTTYRVEGFNGTTYDDLTGTLTSDGLLPVTHNEVFDLSANTTAYSNYRVVRLSGDISQLRWILEVTAELEPLPDTDNDGIPNCLDVDSDNDGCNDVVESGGTDANNDGILDGTGFDADGLVTGGTGGYDGATGNEQVATTANVDATALVDQTVALGSGTSFTITSASATSTTTYTVPGTPDYTLGTDVSSTLVYQWQEDGVNLTNTGVYSGTNTITLSISDVTGLFGNIYNLVITHPDNVCIDEQNSATILADPCDPIASGNTDADGDGIADICDLDDDNDGILDVIENGCGTSTVIPSYDGVTTAGDGVVPIGWSMINGTTDISGPAGWGSIGIFVWRDSPVMLPPNGHPLWISGYRDEEVGTTMFNLIPGETYNTTVYTGNYGSASVTVYNVSPQVDVKINGSIVTSLMYSGSSSPTWTTHFVEFVATSNTATISFVNGPSFQGTSATTSNPSYLWNISVNEVCKITDTDMDGILDNLDLDSDNDGCNDVVESGGIDANNDGILDGTGFDADGLVTGGTGGYDGATGNEIVATQVMVDATVLIDQIISFGSSTTFTITSATAIGTITYTVPGTPDYTLGTDVSGTLVYQWQEDGVDLTDTGVYSGTNTDTLSISDVTGLDGKTYNLIITHPDNVCVDEQNSATLTVLADPCDPIASGNTDTDGDGISDICDLDDDNDGIPDLIECPTVIATDNGYILDLMQAAFHSVLSRTIDGYVVHGAGMAPDGSSSQLTSLAFSPANGYNYTGNLLLATIGGSGASGHQIIALTTDGLWAFSGEGDIIDSGLTTGSTVEQFAMPTGVLPTDVKSILASAGGLVLLTHSGDAHTMGSRDGVYGDGTTGSDDQWHQVIIPAPIDQFRTYDEHVFAITTTGNYYTWGPTVYLGDGVTSGLSTTLPLLMTDPLPVGVSMVQIGITGTGGGVAYFILGSDGRIYSLGRNNNGVLGIGNNTDQLSWQVVQNQTGTGDLTGVDFLSTMDNDGSTNASASVILTDGTLLSWGDDSGDMIGTGGDKNLPTAPNGTSGETYLYVENGGHITPATQEGLFCNVGHNQDGGFGDGTTTSRTDYACNPLVLDLLATQVIDCDVDGDGIPNHLDLDSDGDGCSDALEAGATTDTTTDFQFPTTPVGTDGIPDAVQITSGANSGLVDYTIIQTNPGTFDFQDANVNIACGVRDYMRHGKHFKNDKEQPMDFGGDDGN